MTQSTLAPSPGPTLAGFPVSPLDPGELCPPPQTPDLYRPAPRAASGQPRHAPPCAVLSLS